MFATFSQLLNMLRIFPSVLHLEALVSTGKLEVETLVRKCPFHKAWTEKTPCCI